MTNGGAPHTTRMAVAMAKQRKQGNAEQPRLIDLHEERIEHLEETVKYLLARVLLPVKEMSNYELALEQLDIATYAGLSEDQLAQLHQRVLDTAVELVETLTPQNDNQGEEQNDGT